MSSTRESFVAERQERWLRLERLLSESRWSAGQVSEVSTLYRSICADLARAKALDLGEDVRAHLDRLAGRAHNQLYGGRKVQLRPVRLLARGFPREIRAQWAFFLAASLLFYGPMLLGIVGSLVDTSFAATVLPPEQLVMLEEMYSDDVARAPGDDPAMAGFYVYNNGGIALRSFVTGALAGLGTVFYLVYNGLILGTIKGYLFAVGRGINLLNFIAGHGPWELTGIVVAGAAGLKLGWALVVTEGRTRVGSLRAAGPSLFKLVAGATTLILVAAMIEGFWSATPMPGPIKWIFGLIQIAIVAVWLALGGRGERS